MANLTSSSIISVIFLAAMLTGCLANAPDVNDNNDHAQTEPTINETYMNFSGNGALWHLWKFKYAGEEKGNLYGHVVLSEADPFHEKIVDLVLILDENLILRYGSGAILSYPDLAHIQAGNHSKDVDQPLIGKWSGQEYDILATDLLTNGTYYALIIFKGYPEFRINFTFTPSIEIIGESNGNDVFAYDENDFMGTANIQISAAGPIVIDGVINTIVNNSMVGYLQAIHNYGKMSWAIKSPNKETVREGDLIVPSPNSPIVLDYFYGGAGQWEFDLNIISAYSGCRFWIAGADVKFI
jgi:hypothetical protein